MNAQSMSAEMIAWLERHGGSEDLLASFIDHWIVAVRTHADQPEGPCPACFREGRLAIAELIAAEGGWSRAQCIDCGCRFLWSTRT